MTENNINLAALEPLYAPNEAPNRHRLAAKKAGEPAQVLNGRRPSNIPIANNLRWVLANWRELGYPGVSETSRELLHHWFHTDHLFSSSAGDPLQFSYYFCQREAIETLIYLMEKRELHTLTRLTAEYHGEGAEVQAIGINPSEDRWPRYAFRMATGTGKTKVMSLAMVWSYFHALRESDSPMSKNFLLIAPNLTVFERLKEDFADGRIFHTDPLIPPAWKGDWNLSVVLQDEASGAAMSGTLYLTNIHRLFESRTRRSREAETYGWAGPAVSRASALDTSEALRQRVTSHRNLMVINDEAHHVWDPDSAWNDALDWLNTAYSSKNHKGLTAQLDFSATPKDKDGNIFKHVIVDSPLGEAVDAGIVKVPIIGSVGKLQERADENAAYRYDEHLRLGYERWLKSRDEWIESGKKALLFVMCENTAAADQITYRLNTDPTFEALNGKTINLHINLKGRVKKSRKGGVEIVEFVESEKEISDEDLRALRQLSRELDNNTSPYLCIVSVLMLREGWDVRNVTTIIPLRPYSAAAGILPEQTLGRGLRRITPPGQALEMVTVVEHSAFTRLYQEELVQEGLPIEEIDVERIPRTTVSIFPDAKKDLEKLDISYPSLTDAYQIVSRVDEIAYEDVLGAIQNHPKLNLGTPRDVSLNFEGRAMITNEVVETMKIHIPLLTNGFGAVSFFVKELESACRVTGIHAKIAPLVQQYITRDLFKERTNLTDPRLVARLGDPDVREYVRAAFVPLINRHNKIEQKRLPEGEPYSLRNWKAFQVTSSERNPVLKAERTLFNLVTCNRRLEQRFALFADSADDVAAFAKNAGPQALRIDYEGSNNRRAFYTPDFFVRTTAGKYYLVETKGLQEQEAAEKARAAVAWCKAASKTGIEWEYLFVPETLFQRFNDRSIATLASTCAGELAQLLEDARSRQPSLPFYQTSVSELEMYRLRFIREEEYIKLPKAYQESINDSTNLFIFLENKGRSFEPCFQPLMKALDNASLNLVNVLLRNKIPTEKNEIDAFFQVDKGRTGFFANKAAALKKALVYSSPSMPIGLLADCMEILNSSTAEDQQNILGLVYQQFSRFAGSQLPERIQKIRKFRNANVAHQELEESIDMEATKIELKNWTTGLAAIHKAVLEARADQAG